jgi:heat shock protein HtpX
MTIQVSRLPSRKWSIVALGAAGMATVLFSYLLLILLAFGGLALPFVLFLLVPFGHLDFARIMISAFGLVVGFTIFASLLSDDAPFEAKGVPIDLSKEPRLAREIKAIADGLNEPMPAEVYLVADANAFVLEAPAAGGKSKRRVMGLGLPLLQMLPIAQFRAVLAHEFGHYYAGDTRLGPWVYNARCAMEEVYKNLGKKSQVLGFLRRWGLVAGLHRLLMSGLRIYWKLFMRITQAISRRQEFRSDELACYVAGSQALIDGLENIRKCSAGLGAYWNAFVLPVAMGGYQPDLTHDFQRFMQAPSIAKATSEFLAQHASIAKPSPFDSHPPLSKRIEQARQISLPAPEFFASDVASDQPAISLIDELSSLETGLLKKVVPVLAAADLKPLNWESAGTNIYIPRWRKQVASFLPFLATKKMGDLPLLVLDPRSVAALIPNSAKGKVSQSQRIAGAYDILFCAFATCLLDNGWNLITEPGNISLVKGEAIVDPGAVIGSLRSGKLTVVEWKNFRTEHGIGDWLLATPVAALSAS